MLWVLAFIVLCPLISSGEIVFEDNFDAHPQWSNKQGSRTPKGWTGYSGDWSAGKGYGPDGEIKSEAGMVGNGFRCNVGRDWSAAGLHKLFSGANSRHEELYYRWYQRYSSDFRWNTAPPNRGAGHKWIRLQQKTGPFPSELSRIGLDAGTLYWTSPATGHTIHFTNVHGGFWEWFNEGNACLNNCPGSNKWRCIELRLKLNTQFRGLPSNGIVQVWIDGQLIGEDRKAYIRASPEQYLERIQLGGNMCCFDFEPHSEYYVDIDCFVVSTTPIGPLWILEPPKNIRVTK